MADDATHSFEPSEATHQGRLERLADHGLEITAALAAKAKEADADLEAVARAYDRVSRAVRLAVALSAKLTEDPARGNDRLRAQTESATFKAAVGALRHAEAFEDIEDLQTPEDEAADRLDDDDIHALILARPVSEIVAIICKDLGLTPDWETLTPNLPREAAGGGPIAERSEERLAEGASLRHPPLAASPLPNSS